MITNDLYFRYRNYSEETQTLKVKGYSFDKSPYITEFGVVDLPRGKIRILKCKCSANNWTDNGEFTNEYECASCGQFVTVH